LADRGIEAKETIFVDDFKSSFKNGVWDAVIIDVFLPADGQLKPIGLDLAREIRNGFPALPILLISAWPTERDTIERRAGEIGARVLWKPIRSEELWGNLRSLLGEESHV
jgi:DNA-binding response OmpR family regulator